MEELRYKFTNDTLFKMFFVKYPKLLKRLVAQILGIRMESIGQFIITNPEMPPETMGDKFCRLDINMLVDGQRVDMEVQVADQGDYPERSLFYWAREFSTGLTEGEQYLVLPRTIIVSIVGFPLFDCKEYHSEFWALEVSRYTPLTDKMVLQYFELCKLPEIVDPKDELLLWLKLFNAATQEDLQQIKALGVPIMAEAIEAYKHITAEDRFKEIERMRFRARHDEASALAHERREAEQAEREKWQAVVAKNEAELAEKDAALAEQAAEIARLRKLAGE
jgi:predicted transposase/invertase (TIGR01784 family)